MNTAEIIEQIERLPAEEQKKVFVHLANKVASGCSEPAKRWVGKRLSFEEACDLVFRENRELLSLLAK